MMTSIKKWALAAFALCLVTLAGAQTSQPVSWKTVVKPAGENLYTVQVIGQIDATWHIYDLGPYEGGPTPTSLTWDLKSQASLQGKPAIKTQVHKAYDNVFEMEIGTCDGKVIIEQSLKALAAQAGEVTVTVEWQCCNDGSCLPPEEKILTVNIPAAVQPAKQPASTSPAAAGSTAAPEATSTPAMPLTPAGQAAESASQASSETDAVVAADAAPATETGTIGSPETGKNKKHSLWSVILEAIAWGFVALLTPCVFPMVPMTVSFFLKKNQKNPGRGRTMALAYGLCIVLLYTLPIALIILSTYIFGGNAVTADIFNWLATHWVPNLLFFIIFMVFAASFFGAFEIVLPSKLVNSTDSKSDKGGIMGIFFMALTLVLVSFACTGPIVGSVLIKSTQGEFWEPIIAMLCFSVAFALPFTTFAFAPSLLKNLPKSGGWLNSVKVVLGFIEVALGFKFLSVADQTYHWGLLDREVYLAIWIVCFTLLGLYLLGKIRFEADSPVKHLSVFRLVLVIIDFTFVVYMIPGMWGAPLKALSGYLPPITTQDFVLSPKGVSEGDASVSAAKPKRAKYSDFLHVPFGLQAYFDLDEAREVAAKEHKPMFVDFTGHGCVNCREMESRVWSNPRVLQHLRDDYVMCCLYADDKKQVQEKDWLTTADGKVLKSLGKINSYIALTKFGVNAQPYYTLLDPADDTPLTEPRGYNLDADAFVKFLEDGLKNYKAKYSL